MHGSSGFRSVPQLIMGLLVVFVGVMFTLDNLGVADAERYLRYWPVAIIALGFAKVWQARDGRGGFGGVIFIIAGSWLLLNSLMLVHVEELWEFWPLLLVLLGVSIVWRSLGGRTAAGADSTATVSAVAVLGGVNRGNNSKAFRGGDLTAVMGGCEVDLRQAAIDGEAVIDVFAMWGGIELRVPEDWTVDSRITPLLGGVEDKTRPPQGATAHRLVLRGFAIMGGIEVKN
jgi:predicted membrane protein